MNANDTIFAIALASNLNPAQHLHAACQEIATWGQVHFSSHYVIPCRDGIGGDYWNSACLLTSSDSITVLMNKLEQLEQHAGRQRPSHQISLDVDLIAWGASLAQMQFNPKKMPLALDVKIPMFEIWPVDAFAHTQHHFPMIQSSAVL